MRVGSEDSGGVGLGLPILVALVFANLLGGPMTGSRVEEAVIRSVPARGLESVPARLWRDPLQVAYRYYEQQSGIAVADSALNAPAPIESWQLRDEVARRLGDGDQVILMPVLVSGGTRPEEHETRLRERYAVVSALTRGRRLVAGWRDDQPTPKDPAFGLSLQPSDPTHLGLLEIDTYRWIPDWFDQSWSEAAGRSMEKRDAGAELSSLFPALRGLTEELLVLTGRLLDRMGEEERARQAPLLVPFEWYSGTHSTSDSEVGGVTRSVLVLWMDEQGLQDRPLHHLAALVHNLSPRREDPEAPGESPGERMPRLRIIGPSDSGMLLRMRRDDADWSKLATDTAFAHALEEGYVVSPRSTLQVDSTDGAQLGYRESESSRDGGGASGPPVFKDDAKGAGLRFERTIGTDDELARALIREILRRRPDEFPSDLLEGVASRLPGEDHTTCEHLACRVQEPPAPLGALRGFMRSAKFMTNPVQELADGKRKRLRIALISELDTDYGRAWRKLLVKAVEEECPGMIEVDLRVQYMRGLDGYMSGEDGRAREDAPNHEPATGETRTDYVRRLERLLRSNTAEIGKGGTLESGSVENDAAEHYDAIGILGTDVYDKGMLLQVLRSKFPNAIFFTTDVDARLLPNQTSPHSLGLLVGSFYGMLLTGKYQQGVPPMRSGYQLSTYLSVLSALERRHGEALVEFRPRPQVYEVGRSWIHQLRPAKSKKDGHGELVARQDLGDPNPQPMELPRTWLFVKNNRSGVGFVLGLLALVALVYRPWKVGGGPREVISKAKTWFTEVRWPHVGLIAGAALVFSIVVIYSGDWSEVWDRGVGMDGEPFFIGEGISSWPTIVLRLAAVAAAWIGILKTGFTLRKNWRLLGRRAEDAPSMRPAVAEYKADAGWLALALMTVFPAILYFMLTGLMFKFLGKDLVPVREETAFLIERFVLYISIVSFILLVFLVLRATVVTSRFLRALAKIELETPGPGYIRARNYPVLDKRLAQEALRLDLTGRVADSLSNCIFWPATTMFLMIISRASLFDRWSWPVPLVLTLSLSFLMILLATHGMRSAAAGTRWLVVQRLRSYRSGEPKEDERELCRLAIERAENLRGGVFAPLWEHPLLRAWLTPVAALGVNSSVEFLLPTIASLQ